MKDYKVGDIINLDAEDLARIRKQEKIMSVIQDKLQEVSSICFDSFSKNKYTFMGLGAFKEYSIDIMSSIFHADFWTYLEDKYEAGNYNLHYNKEEGKLIITGKKDKSNNEEGTDGRIIEGGIEELLSTILPKMKHSDPNDRDRE